MADQGITIEVRQGVVYLSGDMNENADLMALLNRPEPLVINLGQVRRFNSTGIRNLLRFIQKWGPRKLSYRDCPCDFIDQVNMIPALLGSGATGYSIESLSIPYECRNCNYDAEIIETIETVKDLVEEDQQTTKKLCPQCASPLYLISEAYLVFLNR